jgi:hypothetical protein
MQNLLKKIKSMKQLRVDESTRRSADPDAILAFRTITYMLSVIQSPTLIVNAGGNEGLSKEERQELRVLDALSAIAVRQHEVVAVIGKSFSDHIEVVASVHNVNPATNIPKDTTPSKHPFRWLITPNPRNLSKNPKDPTDSLTRTTDSTMTLVNPSEKITEGLLVLSKASPENLLDQYLLNEW